LNEPTNSYNHIPRQRNMWTERRYLVNDEYPLKCVLSSRLQHWA